MGSVKRQNFNITPEQESEISHLRELIGASSIKDTILSAVRFYSAVAQQVREGVEVYLTSNKQKDLQKLFIPELETAKSSQYKYLVHRPHVWRRQLYVKGRRLPAAVVYSEHLLEGRTPKQLAHDWELPLEAVHECISYCRDNQALLEMEGNEEKRQLAQQGIYIDSAPAAR